MKKKYLLSIIVSSLFVSHAFAENTPTLSPDAQVRAENWQPSLRYPDPAVEVIKPEFLKYRQFNASLEMLATGLRWAEGPAWNAKEQYLVLSDIPNNRQMKWDDKTNQFTVLNSHANNSNGNIFDSQGHRITAEHLTRSVTRTDANGNVTVLADNYQGKKLNSPNDFAIDANGAIWFADPPFGIGGYYEGEKGTPELDFHGVYRIDPKTNKLNLVLDDLKGPNGLTFSPDGKQIYILESLSQPNTIWRYDVNSDGSLTNKEKFFAADEHGALDGFKFDVDGNLWAGYGSNGAVGVDPAKYDGVIVINPQGEIIGHIHTPERCANLTFGGKHKNRLFMTCSHSLYSMYVNTQGAD